MTVGPCRRNCGVNSLAPYVLGDIMPAPMRTLIPALILSLGACTSAPEEGRPIAKAVTGQQSSTDQAKNLQKTNVSPNGAVAETPAATPPVIDTTRHLEYADVTVALGDPNGM